MAVFRPAIGGTSGSSRLAGLILGQPPIVENGWEFTFSDLSYKLSVAFFVETSFYLRF